MTQFEPAQNPTPQRLNPYNIREMLLRALTEPVVVTPGSATPMAPGEVRQRILDAFVSRGIGNTALEPYRPRASSAGACARALAYHRLDYPETDPPDPEVGLILELGTLLHLYLDAVLVESGLPVETHEHELQVPYVYGEITGHFDRSIGGTTIIDLKSASRASFDLMVATNAPLPSHLSQINFYLHGARLTHLPYTHGLIVAYCKDPGVGRERTPWVSPPLAYDPALAQQTIRMFEEVEREARAGRLVPRPYTIPHEYPCKGCRWRSRCWDVTALQNDAVADLADLEQVAARYHALRRETQELERDRDALGGQIKAAMIDRQAARAQAGSWDITLSRYDRVTVDPELVPAEILKDAAKTTTVTQLRVAKRKNGTEPSAT